MKLERAINGTLIAMASLVVFNGVALALVRITQDVPASVLRNSEI